MASVTFPRGKNFSSFCDISHPQPFVHPILRYIHKGGPIAIYWVTKLMIKVLVTVGTFHLQV